jgi:hypothetical protein
MRRLLVIAAGLAFGTPVLAQSNTDAGSQQTPPDQQVSAKVVAQIRASLESAGLKNVRLAPAFIVRAQSETGDSVEMLIDAESVAAVNETNDDTSINEPSSAGQSSGDNKSGRGRAADCPR